MLTTWLRLVVVPVVMTSVFTWAQISHPSPPNNKTTHPKQEPCWKEAGVSKSALEQRRQVAENMRSQIASVCANSSLSAQQKAQQIRQIREQTVPRMNSIVTPAQMEAVKNCRAQRGQPTGGPPHAGGGGMGPCGEMPMGPNHGGNPGVDPKQGMEPEEPVN